MKDKRGSRPPQHVSLIGFLAFCVLSACRPVIAENCVRVEVLIRNDSPQSQLAAAFVKRLAARWPGLAIETRDVLTDKSALARAQELLKYYKIQKPGVPIIHASRQLIVGYHGDETTGKQIEELLTIHVYVRDGCPHCADGKRFLEKMKTKYPGFKIQIHEITRDAAARDELYALARRYNVLATSVPVFHLCGQLIVGYIDDATTGARIEGLLKQSSVICPPDSKSAVLSLDDSARLIMQTSGSEPGGNADDDQPLPADETLEDFPLEELPLTELPPADGEGPATATAPVNEPPKAIDLPYFGVVSTEKIGLPLFTIAVGLVDGFNPCAMWVLLFLLSILVNLKDRGKILAVAGVFVLISGVAYFAFMAAWLNVFLFVGYLRPAQVILGSLAVVVGGIHIKDFIAHGRGLSLSIPESAKPGIYARVRKIVTAEHLWGAMLGASILAVLVNVIELLCTAGLPALYTQILILQDLPRWQNYAYLGLYNLAYMFDDSLMVAVVVITLGRRKMQEHQGRWLKLVSGVVIHFVGARAAFQTELAGLNRLVSQ
jgi:glutaredoxin